MSKLTILTAGAAGYVLGARAGRSRYEQIAAGARKVLRDPRVQAVKRQARDTAAEQATVVKDAATQKARGAASSLTATITDKVRGAQAAEETWPADAGRPRTS